VSTLVAAELLKLRTIRTSWGFLLALIGLVVLFVAIPLFAVRSVERAQDVRDVLASAGVSVLVMLVFGVVGITTETRHGTLAATFLATPTRWRVIVAKALAHAVAGAAFALVALLAAAVMVAIWLVGEPSGLLPDAGDLARLALGTMAAAALFGALGVGVGAIITGQAAAITAALVGLLVVEPLLATASEGVADYGLNGSESALASEPSAAIGQVGGGLLLLLYAASVVAIGAAVMTRRDAGG